jgi:hypothetical protein
MALVSCVFLSASVTLPSQSPESELEPEPEPEPELEAEPQIYTYDAAVRQLQINDGLPARERRAVLCRFHLLAAAPKARVRRVLAELEKAAKRVPSSSAASAPKPPRRFGRAS